MTILCQAIMPYFTSMPEDVVVNTLSFDFTGVGDPAESDLDALGTLIAGFYEAIFDPLEQFDIAPWCVPAQFRVKMFDLEQPSPRPPIFDQVIPLTVNTSTTSPIAPEVAICLSFQGDVIAGESQARRRGRIFLGGLGSGVQSGNASAFPQPTADALTQAAAGGMHLITQAPGINWVWVVWSRTALSSTVITNGWVDNALDTQRRRGVDPTARTVYPNPA